MANDATFRLISPTRANGVGGGGALALIEVTGGDVDAALARVGIIPVMVGAAVLRDLAGVDGGVVMRVSGEYAVITPHAGPAVVKQLMEKMREAGIAELVPSENSGHDVQTLADITREMLRVLPSAASPAAVDVLLDQPRRWGELFKELGVERVGDISELVMREWVSPHGVELARLVMPATVAAWGAANIGKSTLLNALAKRSVSIVADVPGTTRDHVGVMIELGGDRGGVVVRYVDTPGVVSGRKDTDEPSKVSEIDREAMRLATEVVAVADVVLLCADAGERFIERPGGSGEDAAQRVIRVWLRGDRVSRGGAPTGADVIVSAKTGAGLDALVRLIRERVVSEAALTDPGPWWFWDSAQDSPGRT